MAWLVLALLLVPIAEIYVIVQVGQAIGAGPTILLLIADSVLGAWLVRHEGRRAWEALNRSLHAGRMPTKELADGGLLLVGGTLLMAPGFLTDIVGYFLVLPFTRPIARRLLVGWMVSRVHIVGPPGSPPPRPGPGSGRGRVVSGEVVDDDPQSPRP
ncbi:MAG TPA: FxsA family protein [Sporichthyaceae bacterium]|nr:FxsA family protein [Sporichthyaceae bacterium]